MAELSIQDIYGSTPPTPPTPQAQPAPSAALIPLEEVYGGSTPAAGAPPPKTGMPSLFPQFLYGMRKPIDAGAQLLTRGIEALSPAGSSMETWAKGQRENVEDLNQRAAAEANDERIGMPNAEGAMRAGGEMLATAPLATAAPVGGSLLARAGAGAAVGAAQGALQPVDTTATGGNFWGPKAAQVATGGVTGGAVPLAAGAAARVISPNVSPDVKLLMDKGVTPTPGQILGPAANRVEEAATSIPIVGDAIKAARGRAVEQFNSAAINDALAPIGEKLSSDTPLGREAINEAGSKIRDAYANLVPKLTAQADPQFTANVANLQSMAQSMVPERAAQFNNVLKNQVLSKFSPNGTISGESFKEVESTLGRLASEYRNSAVADERQVGGAFLQLQQEMRGLLVRSNPANAAQLEANNLAYAKLLRVQDASASLGAPNGVFSGAQLLSAVKSNDPTLHSRAFAQGHALSQELADAGKNVLGNKVPDSGTPFRMANIATLAGLPTAFATAPGATTAALGAGAATMGAYSSPGQRALAALLAKRPAMAASIARGVRGSSPALSAYAPIPFSSLAAPQPQ